MNDLVNNICPDCRSIHSSLEDCRDYVFAKKYPEERTSNLNGNAKTFVKATEVITEYQRGLHDGIARREALAIEIMDWTARAERYNIDLDIQNQWLRYQRAGLIVISICFFIAFIAAYMR